MFGKKLTAIFCAAAMTLSLCALTAGASAGDILIPQTDFEGYDLGHEFPKKQGVASPEWSYQNAGSAVIAETERGKSVKVAGEAHCEFRYGNLEWNIEDTITSSFAIKRETSIKDIALIMYHNSDANSRQVLKLRNDGGITLWKSSYPLSDFKMELGKWYDITVKYSKTGKVYAHISGNGDEFECYAEDSKMALEKVLVFDIYTPGADTYYFDDAFVKEDAPLKHVFTQREILNVDFSQYDEGTTWESLYGAPGGAANGAAVVASENGKKYMKLTSTGSYFQPEVAASVPMSEKAFVFEADIRYAAAGKFNFQPRNTSGECNFMYVDLNGKINFGTNNSSATIKCGENSPWYHVTYYYLFDEQTGVVFFDDGDRIVSASGKATTPDNKDITKWGFVLWGGEMDIANMSVKTFDPNKISKQGITINDFSFNNVGDKILDPVADGAEPAKNAYYGWMQTNTKNGEVIRATAKGETVDGRKVVALKDITGTYSEFINDNLGIAKNMLVETVLRVTDGSPLHVQLRGLNKEGAAANVDSGFVYFTGDSFRLLDKKVCAINPAEWYRLSVYLDTDADTPHAYVGITNLSSGETFKADADIPRAIATITRLGFFIPNKPGAVAYIDSCRVSQKGQNTITEAPKDGVVIAADGKLDFAVDLANIDPIASSIKLNGAEADASFDTLEDRRVSVSGSFEENKNYTMEYTFKDYAGGSVTGTLDFKTLASYEFGSIELSKTAIEAGAVSATVNGRVLDSKHYATFIIAVKNANGRILDIELKTIGYSADNTDHTVSAEVPAEEGNYSVSAMLWKSNMQPIQKAAEIK